FQAEDGIRDRNVTGVQTCALPILMPGSRLIAPRATLAKVTAISSSHGTEVGVAALRHHQPSRARTMLTIGPTMEMTKLVVAALRSEERRVGKGGRDRGGRGS